MALTDLEFYAVVPKEATNLITNPSIEIDTTGYTLLQSALARVTTYQRRGVASMSITPNANQIAGAYYSVSLTAGTQYSFSADVLDVDGQSFSLWFADNAGALVGTATTWTGNGHWKRRSVTYTAAATATHRLYLTRASVNSTTVFYTDGWQLETGAASTYLDGDMRGFVRTQTDYYWTGTPHVSTSFRSGQTKSGGTEVRLKDYMTIISVLGLGLGPIINNSLPNVRGGAFFQSSTFDSRTITLSGKIIGLTPGAIMDNRKALIAAINPRTVGADQPMVLRIRGLDVVGGVEQAEPVDAVVQYSGGLEGDWNRPGAEDAPLQFHMFLPYLAADGERGTGITINQSVANADYVMKRDRTGLWTNISTDFNAAVAAIAVGNDGYIYMAGSFTNVGDANGDYIVRVSPSGVISSMGTGLNGAARAIAVSPNGEIYVGGDFLSAGGVANTARIAKWDGAAWASVGGGIAGGSVYALCFNVSGTLFIGGSFTNHGDANGDYLTSWNGAAYASLGSGMDNTVYSLKAGKYGEIYAGGTFTTAGGVSASGIAKWGGTAFTALGSGVTTPANVQAITLGANGLLYVGGEFTVAGGLSIPYIAQWNGTAWSSMGTLNNIVYTLGSDNFGNIYAAGQFTIANGFNLSSRMAMWNGTSWVGIDAVLPSTSIPIDFLVDNIGNFYIGYQDAGSATAPVITSVTNTGSAPAAPRIAFTGPGTVYQVKNTTTGKAIYFNLTLLAGETAVLDLNPDNPTFTSTFRGNILNTILPGSNMDLALLPGANNLSIFVAGTTTAATAITVTYRELFASLDGTRY